MGALRAGFPRDRPGARSKSATGASGSCPAAPKHQVAAKFAPQQPRRLGELGDEPGSSPRRRPRAPGPLPAARRRRCARARPGRRAPLGAPRAGPPRVPHGGPRASPGEGPAGLDRESRRASARPVADVALELDQPSVADLLDRAQPDAASCGRDGARQVAGVGPRVAEPGLPSRRSVPDQLSMEVPAHEGPRSDAVTSCPSASSSPALRRQGRRRSPDRESPRLSAAFPRSAPRSGAVARPGRPG